MINETVAGKPLTDVGLLGPAADYSTGRNCCKAADHPRIGIVHDYLAQAGGAERVVEAISRLYPDAPIFTSVYDPESTLPFFKEKKIITSFLQRTPLGRPRWHKYALPLYPLAFEQFDLSNYDVIISSSSSFAKSVLTNPDCCHICYCHTPARFAWRHHEYMAQSRKTRLLRPLLYGILSNMRIWDAITASRVDYFIANSHNIADRINKFYRRTSDVIFPPVETGRYQPVSVDEVGDHFLVVSRLIGYKRIDLAVEACSKLGVKLKVAGTGPDGHDLRKRAGSTVEFLGRLSDEHVAYEMARCRALIFPGEEDFGITPVECMASGRPVIAYGSGGALETIVDGETGILFKDQTVESLVEALRRAAKWRADPAIIAKHARTFDISVFQRSLEQYVSAAVQHHKAKRLRRSIGRIPTFMGNSMIDDP